MSHTKTNKLSSTMAVATCQQTLSMFAGLVMVPLIIARALGCSAGDSQNIVTIAILVGGLSTALQCAHVAGIGSGYLLMMGSSSLFIAPSIMAGKAGGLPLVFGMTLALAPVELILAPLSKYLRKLAPPSVIGVIVTLIAMAVLPVSMRQFAGGAAKDFGSLKYLTIGTITIFTILFAQFSPWKLLRTGSIIAGLFVGYIIGLFAGLTDFTQVIEAPWLGYPKPFWYGMPKFSSNFILPFAIAYFLTTIETFGDIYAIAHVSGDNIDEIPQKRIRGGLIADAIGSLIAGLLGTTPNTSFSGNIAIAKMSGITKNTIGFGVGAALVALSFLPKLSALIVSTPACVLGGSMLIACAFLLDVGLGMLRSCDDSPLVATIGITAGLAVQFVPDYANAAPSFLTPFLQSSICIGALTAGIAKLLIPRNPTP